MEDARDIPQHYHIKKEYALALGGARGNRLIDVHRPGQAKADEHARFEDTHKRFPFPKPIYAARGRIALSAFLSIRLFGGECKAGGEG